MFGKKSKTDQVKDAAATRAGWFGRTATQTKERVVEDVAPAAKDRAVKAAKVAKERASQAAEMAKDRTAAPRHKAAAGVGAATVAVLGALQNALENKVAPATGAVGEKAVVARDKAVAGIDHGIDAAIPRSQEAVAGMAPRVDHARDVIVDEILPKIQELLGNVQSGKDDLLSRKDGAVAAVTGSPKKPHRKGGLLILLGLLAAVGAGVAYYLHTKEHTPEDPWAPERRIGGAPGVDTQVRQDLAAKDGATTKEAADDVAAFAQPAPTTPSSSYGAAGAADSTGTTTGSAGDAGSAGSAGDTGTVADTDTSDWSAGAETADTMAGEDSRGLGEVSTVHMLDGEEIDELATDEPVSAPIDETVEPSGAGAESGGLSEAAAEHGDDSDKRTDDSFGAGDTDGSPDTAEEDDTFATADTTTETGDGVETGDDYEADRREAAGLDPEPDDEDPMGGQRRP